MLIVIGCEKRTPAAEVSEALISYDPAGMLLGILNENERADPAV
jgi:hypothetical protein